MSDQKKNGDAENSEDYDLSEEKLVAPEENFAWLPQPSPADGEAPAP